MSREIMIPALGVRREWDEDVDGRVYVMRDKVMDLAYLEGRVRVRSLRCYKGTLFTVYAPDTPVGVRHLISHWWAEECEHESLHLFDCGNGNFVEYRMNSIFDKSKQYMPSSISSGYWLQPDMSGVSPAKIIAAFKARHEQRALEEFGPSDDRDLFKGVKFVPGLKPFTPEMSFAELQAEEIAAATIQRRKPVGDSLEI
jgi:hypothetical protein